MIRIRGPDQVRRIDDPDIRALVEERLSQLCDGDPDEAVLVLVEQADTLDALEEETGLAIASSPLMTVDFRTRISDRSGSGPKSTRVAGNARS